MPRVGLCMIVKNEAALIERCLRSVRRLVDYVLVEDTGSTDGTQDIIRAYLRAEGLPGEVFDEPWRDFATNRTLALARLQTHKEIDYALIMDADDVAVLAEDFDPEHYRRSLTADLCHVAVHHAGIRYWRPHLLSNHKPFYYRGVLHEFVEGPASSPNSTATITDFHIQASVEGSRSQNPNKYRDDAELLERALQAEQDPFLISRYTFYMAQSWRDAGEPEKALAAYLRRAELGFWIEERFVSLLNAARIKEALRYPETEVIGSYLAAYEVCPHRAEALHGIMRLCRARNKFNQGYLVGKHAVALPQPSGLFVESWVYEYGLFDEFSILAYWVGRYEESIEYGERALASLSLPPRDRDRVRANLQFGRDKLGPRRPGPAIADQHPGCATLVLVGHENPLRATTPGVADRRGTVYRRAGPNSP